MIGQILQVLKPVRVILLKPAIDGQQGMRRVHQVVECDIAARRDKFGDGHQVGPRALVGVIAIDADQISGLAAAKAGRVCRLSPLVRVSGPRWPRRSISERTKSGPGFSAPP